MSGSKDARPRLFVGVGIPEAAGAAARSAGEMLRVRSPDARWVAGTDRHVTLMYLGSTEPDRVVWIRDRLEAAGSQSQPFLTRLSHLGGFPSDGRARVVWIGLDDPDERFASLARSVEQALAPVFVGDARPFTPHVTIARCRTAVDLRPVPSIEAGSPQFPVDRFALYRSHPGREAGRYEVLSTFHLGPV